MFSNFSQRSICTFYSLQIVRFSVNINFSISNFVVYHHINGDSLEFCFNQLLKAGCDLNQLSADDKSTPLHVAPWELYENILDAGADINLLNEHGDPCILYMKSVTRQIRQHALLHIAIYLN